jgi:hypothetical protein
MPGLRVQMQRSRLAVLIAVAISGAVVSAQNGSQFRDWTPSALPDATSMKPRATCASLVGLTSFEYSVATATSVAASADAPEYCRVVGLIQPEIRFEVSLPAAWNGRLYMFGNGGYAGEALNAQGRQTAARRALARGFATAQTNTGHDAALEPLGTFAANPQKLLDYAFRAVHVTAVTAKRVAQAYYDGAPRHSYFDGCSTGGREGLISAQRFPEDFDGIVVGAPVLRFSGTMVAYLEYQRALAAGPLGADALKAIGEAVYAKCDALDGVKDGVIDDPRRCGFNPSADLPHCPNDLPATGCLTRAELHTLETIHGAVNRGGAEFFPGWPVGAEIATPGPDGAATSGWIPWFVGAGNNRPIQAVFGETFFKYIGLGAPRPNYDWLTFSLEADLDKTVPAAAVIDATDPDLSRFKARGGKIVSYFGWADPALNPMMGVDYYENVLKTVGPSTRDFYRLFMVPGMFHCGGGVGTSTFDALTPLVEWVEKGTAPQTIPAARVVDGKTVRTRPLCPYPETAVYKGSGSTDDAASFTCKAPAPRVPGGR